MEKTPDETEVMPSEETVAVRRPNEEMPTVDMSAETAGNADVPYGDCAVEEGNEEMDACGNIVRSVEQQKTVISYLRDIVFGLTLVLLLFMLIFRVVVVSGPSMMDTLQDGDSLLLISNIFYRNPKQGDIIVASKDAFKDGEPIIKRVIATGGQTVDIDFVEGVVYVDGVALDEPYTKTPTNYREGLSFPVTVPEGCVFVMGDNRNDSLDSRSSQIGMIDRREILGRVLFLAFPSGDPYTHKRDFGRIGVLK